MTTAVFPAPVATPAQEKGSKLVPAHRRRAGVDWLQVVRLLLLIVLPCACYWPALNGAFLWDDDLLITKSPLVQSVTGLPQIWFSTIPLDYFPLTNTTFWLEWRLWGADPFGYHGVNLALHVASALLFWRLLHVLRVPGAWFGAVLFAIHPLNVASVAWISERKNVLSMVFYLGSIICYARSEDGVPVRIAWRRYFAALGLFILAALSKSSVVMLPCVLLLMVWWRTGRVRWRDLGRTLPFFAVSLGAGLVTLWFQYHRAMAPGSFAHANPPLARIVAAGHAVCFYLGKVFWPHPLAMLYPRWNINPMDVPGYLWPVSVVATLAASWWGRRVWGRGPTMAFGVFVLSLLPVSGLLHMSYFSYSNVSDHLAYLATPAILALVGAALSIWYARGGNASRMTLIVMSGIVGLLCLGTFQRAEDFKDPERLWRSTLEINPRCFAAHNNLGLVFQERGQRDPGQLILAEAHFREALKIENHLPSAGVNLANVLRMEGRWAASADVYRKVLEVFPEAECFNNYGVSLLEMGDNPGARTAFRRALDLSPGMENAYYNLYGIELSEHHMPEACAMLRACLRLNPDSLQALTALVTLNLGQTDQPPLSPVAAEVMTALAERTCQLTSYQGAQQLLLLSKATLAAGRKDEAVIVATRAHNAAVTNGQDDMVPMIADYQHSLQP